MGQIANELLALNSAKHAIREAINEKGGGPLERWDPLSAYPGAIANIPSGGGDVSWDAFNLEYHRVIFMDWDGTVLKDVMVKHGDPVEAPEAPSKWIYKISESLIYGLNFEGWTHPAEELASVKYNMCIGAMYSFIQGLYANTFAMIHVPDNAQHISPTLNITLSTGNIRIYWGDGSDDVKYISGTAVHTYTDGEKEHTIFIVRPVGGNGSISENQMLFPYKIFIGSNWTTTRGHCNGFGWPVDIEPPGLVFPSSNYDRYSTIRGYVIPRTASTTQISLHVPRFGTFMLAVCRTVAAAVRLYNQYNEGKTGDDSVYCKISIPVLDFTVTAGRNINALIERSNSLISDITSYMVMGSSGTFILTWRRSVVAAYGARPYVVSRFVTAVSGSLESVTTEALMFCSYLIGLDKLLRTLPERDSSKTITIFRRSEDESLSDELTNELNEKGYTISYSLIS